MNLWPCVFSNVMMKCFFGGNATYEKINGKMISIFICDLVSDVSRQGFEPAGLLLGQKILNAGLRDQDRDINNRIKLFREMGEKIIKNRLEEIEKVGAKENYTDII